MNTTLEHFLEGQSRLFIGNWTSDGEATSQALAQGRGDGETSVYTGNPLVGSWYRDAAEETRCYRGAEGWGPLISVDVSDLAYSDIIDADAGVQTKVTAMLGSGTTTVAVAIASNGEVSLSVPDNVVYAADGLLHEGLTVTEILAKASVNATTQIASAVTRSKLHDPIERFYNPNVESLPSAEGARFGISEDSADGAYSEGLLYETGADGSHTTDLQGTYIGDGVAVTYDDSVVDVFMIRKINPSTLAQEWMAATPDEMTNREAAMVANIDSLTDQPGEDALTILTQLQLIGTGNLASLNFVATAIQDAITDFLTETAIETLVDAKIALTMPLRGFYNPNEIPSGEPNEGLPLAAGTTFRKFEQLIANSLGAVTRIIEWHTITSGVNWI